MALSNIFREPRREITESAVGLMLCAAYVFLDYCFAVWFRSATGGTHDGCPWSLGMILGVGLSLLFFGLLLATHALGEFACGSLARRGVELRPKRRR